MLKGCYQVPMDQRDREETAFVTPLEKYKYYHMLFGFKYAPSTFQRLVDIIFDGTSDYVAVYINDIAVFSETWEEHLQHLEGERRKLVLHYGLTSAHWRLQL